MCVSSVYLLAPITYAVCAAALGCGSTGVRAVQDTRMVYTEPYLVRAQPLLIRSGQSLSSEQLDDDGQWRRWSNLLEVHALRITGP